MIKRPTRTDRTLVGGCLVCHGPEVRWTGPQALAVAALHHDRTGHRTWCDVMMKVRYGALVADRRQIDIEDAIASASSGGEPVAAPVPDPDAPTTVLAGVSAQEGHSVETAAFQADGARGRKPEHVS